MSIRNFQDLIDIAGGINQMCLDLNLHKLTIMRWEKAGFPDKYITPLSTKYNIEPNDLRRLLKKIKK
jgi:hypothetical protein